MRNRSGASGNILFLILLAVILFAALSWAVNDSLRSGGKDVSDEKAKLYASQLLQWGGLVSSTVDRLRLTNDCSDTQISFQYDQNNDGVVNGSDTGYLNPNAPRKCLLFVPEGGGLAWATPEEECLDPYYKNPLWAFAFGKYYYTYVTEVRNVGTTNAGSTSKDLTMVVPFVSDKVCQAINSELGLPKKLYAYSGSTYVIDSATFRGTYASVYQLSVKSEATASAPSITAQAFCVTGKWGAANPELAKTQNYYVQVLIAR